MSTSSGALKCKITLKNSIKLIGSYVVNIGVIEILDCAVFLSRQTKISNFDLREVVQREYKYILCLQVAMN